MRVLLYNKLKYGIPQKGHISLWPTIYGAQVDGQTTIYSIYLYFL